MKTRAAIAVLAFMSACDEGGGPPLATVDITFVFPSTQQQAASANAHAWVLAPRDGTGSCEALIEGDLDPFDTSFIVLDDVAMIGEELGMTIAHAPAGPVIVYGETSDFRGNRYLAGCTTAEIVLPNTSVSIDLRPVGIVPCDTPGVIDGAMCDDGDICTLADTCMGGTCMGGASRDCSALSDQCNTGSCMAGLGCVATPMTDGTTCNDGIACSVGEACRAGNCGGGDYSACCPGTDCREFDCANGVDEDMDFDIDCFDIDCNTDPICIPPENCSNFFDDDGDGMTDCADPECAGLVVCAGCSPGSCPDANLGNMVRDDLAVGSTINSCDRRSTACGDGTIANDVSYSWQAPRAGTYRFQTRNTFFDHTIEVLTDCTGTSLGCTAGFTSEFVDVTLTAGQRVVIVIDGEFGDSGTYILGVIERLTSEAGLCANRMDDDLDLLTDCADADCAADPACQEVCAGGLDEDRDLAYDCEDSDCLGDPACGEAGLCGGAAVGDDDGDGDADCADSECDCAPACFGPTCPEQGATTLASFAGRSTLGRCNHTVGSCIAGRSNANDFAFLWGPAPRDGNYTFATSLTTFDSAIYVLMTNTCDGSATELDCDENPANDNASVTVALTTGDSVVVVVDGVGLEEGTFTMTVTLPP